MICGRTRSERSLTDVVQRVFSEEHLRKLWYVYQAQHRNRRLRVVLICTSSHEKAQDLTSRNHFSSIVDVNPYLHGLLSLLSTLPRLTYPVRRAKFKALNQMFEDETEDGFFEAIDKPSFADLRGRVLASLRYPNRTSRLEGIPDPSPGTCQWIFDTTIGDAKETFRNWLKSLVDTCSDTRVWISGDPGTGKSVLMRYLVRKAQRNPAIFKSREGEDTPLILWHFFNHEGDLIHRTTRGMLLSFLIQLFNQDSVLLDTYFHTLLAGDEQYQTRRTTSAEWEGYALWDLVKRVLGDVEARKKRVYIFIDGPSGFDMKAVRPLDEQPETREFIDFLNLDTQAKIIVAARPEGVFHKTDYQLQLQLTPSLLRPALKTFCNNELRHDFHLGLRNLFTRQVLGDSHGYFTEAQDGIEKIRRRIVGLEPRAPYLLKCRDERG